MVLGMLVLSAVVGGCFRTDPDAAGDPSNAAPRTTDVPLRIWIVSPRVDAPAVERQWKANSDQPIEITAWEEEQFLAQADANADVIVYPARLLGELVDRGWVVKLPEAVGPGQTTSTGPASPGESTQQMAAMAPAERAQVTYDGHLYGVPLGCSIPVVIATGDWVEQMANEPVHWDQILPHLPPGTEGDAPAVDSATVDGQALVDRFLTLVGGFTTRSSKYGILFEMQTMTSRLREPECIQAADVLRHLFRQPGGQRAVVGSHTEAWEWIQSTAGPAVAIVSPTQVDDRSISNPDCRVLPVAGKADFPAGWNTGGGLVGGLAAGCRQTAQSTEFLRWLSDAATRTAVAPLVGGIDPMAPLAGVDSLAWRARRSLDAAYATDAMPREPALAGAHSYRKALAEQLLSILLGEKTPEEGLEA
ncbi:MAG: hypothetical protein D6753_11420, partial [Planctomycetota bacterium]